MALDGYALWEGEGINNGHVLEPHRTASCSAQRYLVRRGHLVRLLGPNESGTFARIHHIKPPASRYGGYKYGQVSIAAVQVVRGSPFAAQEALAPQNSVTLRCTGLSPTATY